MIEGGPCESVSVFPYSLGAWRLVFVGITLLRRIIHKYSLINSVRCGELHSNVARTLCRSYFSQRYGRQQLILTQTRLTP